MYVVTFYSFKGGVGRTMALVNVAAELSKRGRRVLMVDFDLEAPGLSDFELIEATGKTPGLVEFITEYEKTGTVPDVANHVYQSKKYSETSDRLWVMPAGCQNGDYQALFSAINWQNLYESKNGFLLMEDLRSQWEKVVNPDYVFIDSRTGYTDIAGICTRQLPDAVCMLFTPNKQNLTGLTRISSEIRAQSNNPKLRKPRIHFVASNIPNLDDDEDVLKKALGNFSRQLEYVNPSAIIHHYNSFALINEAVFTLEFPKNPLSMEYRSLAEEISKENFLDRISAIDYLRSLVQSSINREHSFSEKEADQKLVQIEGHFSNDAEVLFWLSRSRRTLGNLEEAEVLLDAAIRNGLDTPRGYLDRAVTKINHSIDRDDAAIWEDLKKVLAMENKVLPSDLLWTIKLSMRIGHNSPQEFLSAPALRSLASEDIIHLSDKLHDSRYSANITFELLTQAIDEKRIDYSDIDDALNTLAISAIALGRLEDAKRAIERLNDFDLNVIGITSAFNLGMAKYWTEDPDYSECFKRVINFLSVDSAMENANYLQCLSFSYFAVNDTKNALRLLEDARAKIDEQPIPMFSCWRYLEVNPLKFKEDLFEMERLYSGENVKPIFCRVIDMNN